MSESAKMKQKPLTSPQQKLLNAKLWQKVHGLEFQIQAQLKGRKRDKKDFGKQLVRLAKILSAQKYSAEQVKGILEANRAVVEWDGDGIGRGGSGFLKEDAAGLAPSKEGSQVPFPPSKAKKRDSSVSSTEEEFFELNRKMVLEKQAARSLKTEATEGTDNDTESASDFSDCEDIHNFEMSEIAGKVSESLLVSTNYATFSKACGFEPIDPNINPITKEAVPDKE